MNNSVIVVDDDDRLSKIKAFLESFSIPVFTAENLYELMGKIYKHNIRILIFNPHLVWVNVTEFISELKKRQNLNECKIFFLCENMDKDIEEKAQELNVTCINYPSHITKLISHIESINAS